MSLVLRKYDFYNSGVTQNDSGLLFWQLTQLLWESNLWRFLHRMSLSPYNLTDTDLWV